MPDSTGQASEVAFALAELVADKEAFPDQAARELHDVLGHRLSAPSTSVLRYDRLQLLLEMLLQGTVPTVAEYNAKRALGTERQAPAASTLIASYGHWLAVCRAAGRFVDRGTTAPMPHRLATLATQTRYRPSDVTDAIARYHARFGLWPTQWEYLEWGTIQRTAAHRTGAPDPRIPGTNVVRRLYGTYPRALAAAKRDNSQ